MPHETDPLLPAYSPSPEITNHHQHHHHNNHSAEISYDTTVPQPDATLASGYQQWQGKARNEYGEAHWDDDGDEENGDTSRSLERGMANVFRTVFTVIFFGAFFAIVVKLLESSNEGSWQPPWPDTSTSPLPGRPGKATIEERVKAILNSTPLIDGHDDFAIFIRGNYGNNITSKKFRADFEDGKMTENVDLPRLRAGMNGGAFWSAFAACPPNASYDMSDANYATEVAHTLEQIDVMIRLQAQYATDFTSPNADPAPGQIAGKSGRELMLAQWHATRSFFGPISIEGLHQVLPSAPMSALRQYYALGVRMATLTWNCHNAFADAALISGDWTKPPNVTNEVFRPNEGAVTRRGRDVIKEMNRLGMIVDISHTSYWTQKAILSGVSRAPVVFSHSSAYSICPHPRNVKDDILDLVSKSKSVVMVNFTPGFISCTSPDASSNIAGEKGEPQFSLPEFYEKNNTLHQIARHITYIGDRLGYDYVGLGSDFDGMGELTPKGLDGVDKFPDLVAELLKMGVSDEDMKKVVGGNVLRVWKDVDEVAEQMKKEGVQPGLDDGSGY